MEKDLIKIHTQLVQGAGHIQLLSDEAMSYKSSVKKWSKKEILGHLIDSAVNNWQRFVEMQFKPQPYQIQAYDQNALVVANNYQYADTEELLTFPLA